MTYKKVVKEDLRKEADKLAKMDPDNAKDIHSKQVCTKCSVRNKQQITHYCFNSKQKICELLIFIHILFLRKLRQTQRAKKKLKNFKVCIYVLLFIGRCRETGRAFRRGLCRQKVETRVSQGIPSLHQRECRTGGVDR